MDKRGGRIILASVFSPNMLGLEEGEQSWVIIERVSLGDAKHLIENATGPVKCSASTRTLAKLLEKTFNVTDCTRKNLHLAVGDTAVIFTVKAPRNTTYAELEAKIAEGAYKVYVVRR